MHLRNNNKKAEIKRILDYNINQLHNTWFLDDSKYVQYNMKMGAMVIYQ